MLCQVLFWASVALLFHTFLGYQLLIGMLGGMCRRRAKPAGKAEEQGIAVVIVARNEAARIGARIRNLLATPGRLEVVVCSDGSTDGTAAEARAAGARVFDFATQRGKAACLSEVVPGLEAPIVVFTDCRQEFTPETIPRLARHLADPAIGAVSGILRIGDPRTSTGEGVDIYWRMETAIRKAESDYDSCVGCTGAVYAVRRELFQPIPPDTILDDVVIPMKIAMTGHRVVYDSEAEAYDPQPLDPEAETRRKTRTLAGNFQMLFRHPGWLLPWRNRLAWQLISHKYLRLAGPALLACALVSNIWLAGRPFYQPCLAGQVLLYALAAAGIALPGLRLRIFSIPAGFVFLNVMTVRGLYRYVLGGTSGGWERADS
jgi:cellulose synthase/poly-beta-1,6-N-acetylglucosamine synthase-like glycosyltransferase